MPSEPIYAINQKVLGNRLYVKFSDGKTKMYNAIEMGCQWFKMSNDTFYDLYGFAFNPHRHHGLYAKCRKLVHGE